MPYELRDNSGNMFKNTKKQPGEKTPDYRGDVMVNGKVMQIAGWVKAGKNGNFLSLSFSPPRPQPVQDMGEYQAPAQQAVQDSIARQTGRPHDVAAGDSVIGDPVPSPIHEADLPF